MRVREKKTGGIYEVYPQGRPEGIRFVCATNSKLVFKWEELEAYIEIKKPAKSVQKHIGVKIPIGASASVNSSSEVATPRRAVQQNRSARLGGKKI
jgi:hypothetical protein